jgi:hypothetical protein
VEGVSVTLNTCCRFDANIAIDCFFIAIKKNRYINYKTYKGNHIIYKTTMNKTLKGIMLAILIASICVQSEIIMRKILQNEINQNRNPSSQYQTNHP